MAKVLIEFRVKINFLLNESEKVFITGSLPELGGWRPMDSKILQLQESHKIEKFEIWGEEILLPTCNLEYRYFIGTYDENGSYEDRIINIQTWESHIFPRKMSLIDRIHNKGINIPLDIYGQIDDHVRLLTGWLTDYTAVNLRLYNDPIKLYGAHSRSKRVFIKCFYFQMNRHKDSILSEEGQNQIYNLAKVSKLSEDDCLPTLPPEHGIEYCHEHLTFHIFTIDLEDMGIEIEIRQLSEDIEKVKLRTLSVPSAQDLEMQESSQATTSQSKEKYVMIGTARLGLLPVKRAIKSLSIYNQFNRPVGEIKVDFLAIFPLFGHQYNMDKTYQMHWKHRKTLKVGHKGSGTSYGHTTKMSAVRENTLYSLKNAYNHGADFVEFDVQLSKDLIPVIYHDFKVCTVLRKKKKNDLQFLAVPVKDLNLSDLQALKLDHTSAMTDARSNEIMNNEDIDPTELQPFPTLEDCLDQIPTPMGFNIELKYPQLFISGENEQTNYFERNVYVDTILKIVAQFAKNRLLIFSCFDADVCLMLSLKQNKYPVFFLTQGDTREYEAYKDPRTQSLENGMYFIKSCNILGICAFSSNVAEHIELVQKILDMKLILFLWGESNNDIESHKRWISLGVHGIIFDRIHEVQEPGSIELFQRQRLSTTIPFSSSMTSETLN